MSSALREELLPRMRQRYVNRGREGRRQLIDELCEQWGYSRKHAIKLLNGTAGWGPEPGVSQGRPADYGAEVAAVAGRIWLDAEQPCGKRLHSLLELWMPYYEREYMRLPPALRKKVLAASPATLDRLLKPWRSRHPTRGACGTRPGSLLRTEIPIRTGNWDITRPGYLEADTVAHCGESLAGNFIWSISYTDICSGWGATRAVWNRGATDVLRRTQDVEQQLPFPLVGFDCDNGGEFLNWHLVKYFTDRPAPVGFTRSRPYHKDDNGHVEQKNWMRVRQLLGYQRLDNPELVERINELYRRWWDPLHNFFLPSAKLSTRYRQGSRIVRQHDQPRTPCDRLLDSPHITGSTKQQLRMLRRQLNPYELKRHIEHALREILPQVPRSGRPPGSLRGEPEACKNKATPVS